MLSRIMQFPSPYVRCDGCSAPMTGIRSVDARTTCRDCGGHALIGDSLFYQERVWRARQRLEQQEPPRFLPPRRPYGPEAA